MFNHSPSNILYIRWNALEMYRDSKRIAALEFPVEIVNHLEILDFTGLEKLLTEFFKKLSIAKEDALLLLSEKTVFYKNIPNTKEGREKLRETTLSFFDEVPFGPETVIKKILPIPESIQLLAANKKLIFMVKEIYELSGGKIRIALPDIFFGQLNEVLSPEVLKQIQRTSSKLERANFLEDDFDANLQKIAPAKESVIPAFGSHKKRSAKMQYVIITVVVVILVGALLFVLWKAGIITLPKQSVVQKKIVVKLTNTPVPTKAQEATASAAMKKNIKVQILNGSGVEGQAGVVKTQLQKIGYENFELGNAQETSTNSAIFVSPTINQPTFEELYTALSEVLPNVKKVDKTDSASFDIVVITGKK